MTKKKVARLVTLTEQKDRLERCIFVLDSVSNTPFYCNSLYEELMEVNYMIKVEIGKTK